MAHETDGSPFTPHAPEETAAMLDAVGVQTEDELFDIPDAVAFDDSFGIDQRTEREIREECAELFGRNDELIEFLGRGHYGHYIPSVVDDVAGRSEFLTSYTQYQPEIAQGFLQALFEYQSMFVELTGLPVVNCSSYDAAAALGEAATMATRLRGVDGDRVLVPEAMVPGRRSVLENYLAGTDVSIEAYPFADGTVDVDGLRDQVDADTLFVYLENPTVYGTIEPAVVEVCELADDHDALATLGTDPVAMGLLAEPASQGVDVVIGDAASLGLPTSHGMGLGLFATRDTFLRQVPGRLVGATTDDDGRRAYTLTLQTREQHIRRERATSNICTNQAWVGLRTAMHLTWLGADGLVDLASECVELAAELAARLDEIEGVTAPVYEAHHFREFVARTDASAKSVADALVGAGYAVHVLDDDHLQMCVTELTADAIDGLVKAFEEATA